MGYEGHLLMIEDPEEKHHKIQASVSLLVDTAAALEAAGHRCGIVSCGGTGSIKHTVQCEGVTEIQASGGMFSDLLIHNSFGMNELEYSMFVLATVTSRPTATRVIVDSGRKSLVHWELLEMPAVVEGKYAESIEMKVALD